MPDQYDTSARDTFFGAVFSLAIIGAIILAGWWVGWWFRTENTQRESHLNRQTYGFQQADRDRITTEIGDVFTINTQLASGGDPAQLRALAAQREAVVAMVCRDATQISGDPLPVDQSQFVSQHCEAGAVSPASPYAR